MFQEDFTKRTTTVLFAHRQGHFPRVRNFISLSEEILGVSTSEVGATQRKTISYILPSDFWIGCPMRRSLFSILLRVGMKYEGDFDEAVRKNYYAAKTQAAIERFFAGHTTYTGRMTGWCDQFAGRSSKRVERLLV